MRHEMNVTPMIDVLLVLLITFMLMILRFTINIQVAQENGSQSQEQPLVLELTADGGYALNTIPVGADSLGRTLREVFAVRPNKTLFVKSAPQRVYAEAIHAIDVAKGAGVEVIALAP